MTKYFANCNLLEATEVLLRNVGVPEDEKETLEKHLWDKVLHFRLEKPSEGSRCLLQHGWQQSWSAVRLLHILRHGQSQDVASELDETLSSSRKEAVFTSLLECLNHLTSEHRKVLKAVFSKILLANLISKEKILPKLDRSTEDALLDSLIAQLGETHCLMQLMLCQHNAFKDINQGISDLYSSAVISCLHRIRDCENSSKDILLNALYGLLILTPPATLSVCEEIGALLYSLCLADVLELDTVLRVTSCCSSLAVYEYLTGRESKRKLRHIDCSNATDTQLVNGVYQVITKDCKVSLEELFLRVVASKCHWVEELVGMATQFVVDHDWEKLHTLVFFPALWPVLAVNVWKLFSNRADILNIVNPILEICQSHYPDQLSLICETTKRLKVVTDWLTVQGQKSLPDVNVMLSLARNHSPLHILQATTNLVDLDHHRLLDLLLELEGPNSWNVQVFEGFTILFSVFQILEKAVDIFNKYEKEDSDCDLMCLKYKEEVSKPISELDKSINKLEPLDFRLEVLEDIFLLLFLRSEDYCEEKDCVDSSTEDPEEGHSLLPHSVSDSGAPEPPAPVTSRRRSSPGRASTCSSYPSTTTTHRRSAGHRRGNKSFAAKFSQGYVCYPWLASDILGCLKRSLEHLETICDHFGCDRLKRLKGSVDDAAWRLAMVSDASAGISRGVHSRVETWVYEGGDSSDSDDTPSLPPSPKRKGRKSRRLGSSSRSESSSNVTFGPKFSSSASVTSSLKTRTSSRLFSTSSNLINLMLASPSCLVSYFIAKEDLGRAKNAVERFNMRGSVVDVELNFLKEFSSLRNNILEADFKNSDEKSSVKNSTLQAISETTSSGVLNVTLTKLVETFFVLTPLPEEVGDNKGVVVLDLALSPLPSLKHSICLLDLARTYTRTALASPVKGTVEAFTQAMRRVVDEIDESSSLTDILLDPCIPLRDPDKISDLRTFWVSLQECLRGFQSSKTSADNDLADAAFLKLTSCIVVGQGLVQNYQDDTKEHFLNHLRSYLTCLWKIVSHKIPAGTKYQVLEHDLDTLVGELVFSESKDPLDIEAALEPVSVNVVHLVMAYCTPSISIRQLKQRPATIVLNSCHQTCESKGDLNIPEEISSLLSKLLDVIEWKSSRALADLPTSPRVQEVLAATCCLQQLDWTQLVPGDQLFAFLVNLYNLIWLHALILLEISDEYGLVSPSACLRDLSAQSVGYMVGECYVTLADLRSALAPFPTTLVTLTVGSRPLPVYPPRDPRALFLLGNPYKLSPSVEMLPSRDVDRVIDTRMTAFVEATVQVREDSVTVPVTLCHYIDYVTLTQGTESEYSVDNISNSSREHIPDFLKEFLKRDDITGKEIIIKKDIALTITKSYTTAILTKDTRRERDDETWKSRCTRPEVLKYLCMKNPLFGQIVEKIHCIESGVETVRTPTATTPLERELLSEDTCCLAALYEDNVMRAALESIVDSDRLWLWLDAAVLQQDWQACLDMLSSIPEKHAKTDPRYGHFRDWVLEQLSPTRDGWRFCQNMEDPQRLCQQTLANLDKWPLQGCITVLNVLLSLDSAALSLSDLARARELQTSMQTTSKVTQACTLTSTEDAWEVLEELLKCGEVHLALQWFHHSDLINVEHSSQMLLLIGQLLLDLLERGQDVSAQELLQLLPSELAVQICENILTRAQSVSCLQQIVHFLQSQATKPSQALRYTHYDIGVHMLNHIPWQEQEWYRDLASQPELLVEQLLMSTRISTLEEILGALRGRLCSLPPGSPLSPPCLDALLRRYAARAVDVRVRTRELPTRRQLTPELPTKFTPPDTPPTKQEWVANDEVTECMCCQSTRFSMFNRRHHCRRCGRVVCGNCSPHRFKVCGYGNVKVRICSDCYEYVLPRAIQPEGPRRVRAESRDSELEWWLTKDLVYNATVREEFTYTHAPSVALCLSILKLHTEHSSLLRFLFNTIEMMLRLLRPISPGIINPEVDYTLLITMIRSLLEFAKLSCSQYGSGSEWATVDELFVEVDLLGMLVASPQTCAMLPTEPLQHQSLQSGLSTVRENLLRSELWTLALEVSTKAGLDYNSVWLAWGKACLKAGAWTEARDKFAHCNPHKKDTQMLSDIMQILQDNPQLTDLKSRLGRLKTLVTKPETLHINQGLEPRVYEECLYYLRTYGSYATTLSFYLNQNDIKSAVCLLLEGAVDLQVYLENLFLPALQSGRVTEMYTCMASIDKTFTVFKEYLRVSCAYCERHQLFHVLYQVQVLTGDHVRAALTCIHFFRNNARNYGDLASTKGHLETALDHLQQALKPSKEPKNPLVMQLSGQELTRYLSTARLQLEVVVFLASATPEVTSYTLFGSSAHRVSLAAAVVAAGDDLEQSLALAARVTEDWQQGKSAVLCPAAAQLVRAGRASVVRRLVTLFRSEPELCNELLIAALKEHPQQSDTDPLMALITGVPSKITAMIECGQLKSAYLLAVKHDRLSDIQRIMEAADQWGQPLIKKICLKRLNIPDEL